MIQALRIFFVLVLVSMVGVTSWAGAKVALWEIPASVGGHPWFIATLFDTYWAFFTFYLWVCYKERSALARVVWFVAIVLLGNMAMAAYALAVLWHVPRRAPMERVLLRGEPVPLWVPLGLMGAFAAIVAVAAGVKP